MLNLVQSAKDSLEYYNNLFQEEKRIVLKKQLTQLGHDQLLQFNFLLESAVISSYCNSYFKIS